MKTLYAIFALMLVFASGCLDPGCTQTYDPVCGDDGETYPNSCYAEKAGVNVYYEGVCIEHRAACNDTDPGRDVLVKGTTTADGDSFTDSCEDSSTVLEYYCQDGLPASDSVPCPSGHVCVDGGCVPQEEMRPDCEDSDGGADYFTPGKVVSGSGTYQDSCKDGVLTEYKCSDGEVQSVTYSCEEGCAHGMCTNQKCTDTEYGETIYSSGTVNLLNDSGWFTFPDKCVSEGVVTEYTCDGDEMKAENISCPPDYTCYGGVCYPDTACYDTDSDLADGRYQRGTVYYDGRDYKDYCMDEDIVVEYSCTAQRMHESYLTCPTGHTCSRGACVEVENCEDTDGGRDYYETGTTSEPAGFEATDQCMGETRLLEYFCDEHELVDSVRFDCPSGFLCSAGRCVEASACSDSDGGTDYYEQGTTEMEGFGSETDYCMDNTVIEFFCDGSTSIDSVEFACPPGYGCIDGACDSFCTDSDGGNDPEVFGEVYYGSHVFADYCIDEPAPTVDRLVEYHCSANGLSYEIFEYPCSGTCSGGACSPLLIPE